MNEQQKQGADVGAIVKNGTWLAEFLKDLRTPKRIRSAIVPKSFCATLRPYQKSGFTWLNYMNKLKFGACLADDMPYVILHGGGAKLRGKMVEEDRSFLTIITYGMAMRIEELESVKWDCLILNEAQAMKNPYTKQTKKIKALKSSMRIAMTGTPIENDLTNLWSLFDFLNKGLLEGFSFSY